MARPKPEILCSYAGADRCIDVLATTAVWGVTHLGKLVSMRYKQYDLHGETVKYPKTLFPSKASAFNCARRLNAVFDTTVFSIAEVLATESVTAPEPDLSNYEHLEPN